jgi:hypothetical protein
MRLEVLLLLLLKEVPSALNHGVVRPAPMVGPSVVPTISALCSPMITWTIPNACPRPLNSDQ